MLIGVVAMLTLTVVSLSVSSISKQRVVALNLAREGIEIVRAIRDTGWLQNDQCWNAENDFCGLKNGSWIVDYNTIGLVEDVNKTSPDNLDNINNCSNCQLKIDEDNLYNISTGSPTPFKRMITISKGDFGEEKKVVSQVQWQEHNHSHSIELEVRLTNWR